MSALVDHLVGQVKKIFQKSPLPETLSCTSQDSSSLRSFILPQLRTRPTFSGEKRVLFFFFKKRKEMKRKEKKRKEKKRKEKKRKEKKRKEKK